MSVESGIPNNPVYFISMRSTRGLSDWGMTSRKQLNKTKVNKTCIAAASWWCVQVFQFDSNEGWYLFRKKEEKQGDHDDAREITAVWCSNVKKTNSVDAILDFCRAFLNHFWPNLAHTYTIHFWISFVLCVVFKCQYFWSYSRKNIIDHIYTYFKGP